MHLYIQLRPRAAGYSPRKEPAPKWILRCHYIKRACGNFGPHAPLAHIHHFEFFNLRCLQGKTLARSKIFVAGNHEYSHSVFISATNRSSVLSIENSLALSIAERPRASAAPLSCSIFLSAACNASSSCAWISRPSTPSRISSGLPPTDVATIGVPRDITSISVCESPS